MRIFHPCFRQRASLLMFSLGICLLACNRPVTPPVQITQNHHTESTDDPTREVIIQAVRDSVSGQTISVKDWHWETRPHYCSQMDVETDPNAKNNPELARCPHVGATFNEQVQVATNVNRPCTPLDGPQAAWYVQKVAPGRWTVSLWGKGWRVDQLPGSLKVTPDQPCA